MKKLFYILLSLTILPTLASAQDFGLEDAVRNSNLPRNELEVVAANIIQVVLGFVGIIFMVLILYGGFQWMTSGGNEEKVKSAKKIITNSTIGLVVIVTAYSVTYYITTYILQAAK